LAKLHGRGVKFGQTIKITKKVEKTLKNCENELVATHLFEFLNSLFFGLDFHLNSKRGPTLTLPNEVIFCSNCIEFREPTRSRRFSATSRFYYVAGKLRQNKRLKSIVQM
jgi:hypothetical protein